MYWNTKLKREYDLALCMGNSLNFFNAEDISCILKNIHLI